MNDGDVFETGETADDWNAKMRSINDKLNGMQIGYTPYPDDYQQLLLMTSEVSMMHYP